MFPPARFCRSQQYSHSARPRLLGNGLTCLFLLPLSVKGLRASSSTAALPQRVPSPSTRTASSWRAGATTAAPGLAMREAQRHTRLATTAAAGEGTVLSGSGPSVCVIGAGAAGLAAARILRDEGCRVRILEKSLDVGGVWRYKTEPDAKAPMCESGPTCPLCASC